MSVLKGFLDPGYSYNYEQGPKQIHTKEDALQFGLNCIALGHLAIKDLHGIELPSELHCYEMFSDYTYFTDVSLEDARPGDFVWFGVERSDVPINEFIPEYDGDYLVNAWQFPVNHLAIFMCHSAEDGPLLLHASQEDGGNVVWPLGRFLDYGRYRRIYRISRLKGEES